MAFLLDTNIFITSKNLMPFDIFPSFWKILSELAANQLIFSSVLIKTELEQGNDDLKQWCKDNLPANFFLPTDDDSNVQFGGVITWANSNPVFFEAAKNEFASVADSYLVAVAKAHDFTVVTYETSDPHCRRRVKIPDACIAMGVNYCSLNDMFRSCGVKI